MQNPRWPLEKKKKTEIYGVNIGGCSRDLA